MSEEQEIWKDIPGYEGLYSISTTGRIWSYITNAERNPSKDKDGYRILGLYLNKRARHFMVHKLVMLTFVGERPAGLTINHKNGVKSDNHLENLEYVTHLENMQHAYSVLKVGGKGGRVLTENLVREIRQIYAEGKTTQVELAKRYGVTQVCISAIVTRTNWAHLK